MLMRTVRANKTQLIGPVLKNQSHITVQWKYWKRKKRNSLPLSDSPLFPTTDPQLTAISPSLLSPIPPHEYFRRTQPAQGISHLDAQGARGRPKCKTYKCENLVLIFWTLLSISVIPQIKWDQPTSNVTDLCNVMVSPTPFSPTSDERRSRL